VGVLERPEHAGWFAGNELPEGSLPIAQAYAGHQFGNFTGLGDGRAVLLGEHLTPSGVRYDVQLKGSGRTNYSRGGDGRAVLGPMLREYLMGEAMAGLGIPTTRALAVALTGEEVFRDGPQPGAVLMRVAASHIRVGTFQWAAAHEDEDALGELLRYTARRHFPALDADDARGFFMAVMERQIELIVGWMRVGFVHGVMNTDNMALSGETIDYGPCAFVDGYDPDAAFSSIDHQGRYSFSNQPWIARWNLARLAEAMLPLLDGDRRRAVDFANEALGGYEEVYEAQWLEMMRGKLGLAGAEAGDLRLVRDLLDWMAEQRADYTNTFRELVRGARGLAMDMEGVEGFDDWCARWRMRLGRQVPHERIRMSNPAVIPRNHMVERVLMAATEGGDFGPLRDWLRVLGRPYDEPDDPSFMAGPGPEIGRHVTYCGT
jgi:uncharacterized protein YdiU (UPF0061 family)